MAGILANVYILIKTGLNASRPALLEFRDLTCQSKEKSNTRKKERYMLLVFEQGFIGVEVVIDL